MTAPLTPAQQALVVPSTAKVLLIAASFRADPATEKELVSSGYLALTLAASSFVGDPALFWAFARHHVRGAMLRTMGKEHRARKHTANSESSAGPRFPPPREVTLDDLATGEGASDREDVVRALEAVTLGFLGAHSLRLSRGEESLLERESAAAIADELNRLDERTRVAYIEHVANGRIHVEVAAELGVSKRTLQRLVDTAERALRARLGFG